MEKKEGSSTLGYCPRCGCFYEIGTDDNGCPRQSCKEARSREGVKSTRVGDGNVNIMTYTSVEGFKLDDTGTEYIDITKKVDTTKKDRENAKKIQKHFKGTKGTRRKTTKSHKKA